MRRSRSVRSMLCVSVPYMKEMKEIHGQETLYDGVVMCDETRKHVDLLWIYNIYDQHRGFKVDFYTSVVYS